MRKLTAAEQITINRILELASQGVKIRTIIATLNFEGHRTKNGGPWLRDQVQRVLERIPQKSNSSEPRASETQSPTRANLKEEVNNG